MDLAAARQAYDELGYFVAPPLFDADEVERFRHRLTFHGSGANTSDRLRRSLAVHFVDATVTAVAREGIWQHYNLALFTERGGRLGEPYQFDDVRPLVYPAA